jgi:hypothetical protein
MKKLLALVLALVMTLGLATVSSSAALSDFSDASDVNYEEAMAVMNAVGVFVGDNGKLAPKDNLTRAQAAKIIAYLDLGEKAAEALNGTGAYFTDVAASNWAAGYIGYCAQAGYVNGIGDGKFDPNGKLTGLQFAKMLLTVLGYDVNVEKLVGSDWAINAAKLGSKNDLYKGLSKASSAVLTREEAAQMALNALQATMVEYDTKGTDITIGGGTSITVGASKAEKVTKPDTNKNYSKIDDATDGSNYYVELGEELYEGKLVKKENGQKDDLGRKAIQWTYKNDEIGTYATKADETYTLTDTYAIGTNAKYADLLAVLQDEDFTDNDDLYFASLKGKQVYVNGKGVDSADKAVKDALVNAAKGGTTVELYYNDDDKDAVDYVVILNYSVAQIDKVDTKISKSDKDDGATCKVKLTDGAGSYTDNNITGFNASTFVKDAYVLYIKDAKENDELADAQIAEEIEGEVTAVKGSNKATINGTTYKYVSGLNINVEDEGTFYLNVAGQIVKVDATSHNDYIYIYSVDNDNKVNTDGVKTWTFTAYYVDTNGVKGSAEIDVDEVKVADLTYRIVDKKIVKADEGQGTCDEMGRTVGFYFADTTVKVAGADGAVDLGESVIAYSLNSYKELTYETPKDTISAEIAQATFKKDKASGTDSDTQFVFCYVDGSKQKVSTAVGYKNVNVANVPAYTIKNSDGDILYVFVTAKNGSVASDDSLAVVLDKTPTQTKTKKGDDTIYTYKVAIDGEETTLSFKKGDAPKGTLNKGDVIVYAMDGDYATANSADIDTTLYSANAYEATKDYVSIKSGSSDPVQYNLSDAKAIYTINVELKSDNSIDSVYVTEGADIDGATFEAGGTTIKVDGSKLAYTLDDDKLDVLFVYDYIK